MGEEPDLGDLHEVPVPASTGCVLPDGSAETRLLRRSTSLEWITEQMEVQQGGFRRGDNTTRATTSPRTVSGSLNMAVPQTKEELFEVTKCCLDARAAREGRNRRGDASQQRPHPAISPTITSDVWQTSRLLHKSVPCESIKFHRKF